MSGEEVEMQGGKAWKGDQSMGEEEGKEEKEAFKEENDVLNVRLSSQVIIFI